MKVIKITNCEECPRMMLTSLGRIRLAWCCEIAGTVDDSRITDPNQIKPNCPLEDAPVAPDTGVFLGG